MARKQNRHALVPVATMKHNLKMLISGMKLSLLVREIFPEEKKKTCVFLNVLLEDDRWKEVSLDNY